MSVSLSTLVSRLQSDVPARNSVPSAEQYERAVTDAVADFSRRCPMERSATLSIVSGTASYALPSDLVRLIQIESLTNASGVILSDVGIIPVSSSYSERLMVQGSNLTIYPTPEYTVDRDIWYLAGQVLDANQDYPDMDESMAGIVLLGAAAKALQWQANAAALEAWQYQIGDERVNKERLADALRAQAQEFERRFQAAAASQSGPYGSRSTYTAGSYA